MADPLVRTPNGDDAPADIGMGIALSVLLAICLFATGAMFALEHFANNPVNTRGDTHPLTTDLRAGGTPCGSGTPGAAAR
jgi:hypothetical protein